MIHERDKDMYREKAPSAFPIFYQPFFLDVVTHKNWDVACAFEGNELMAAMPFPVFRKKNEVIIRQPPFTIYLGPIFTSGYKSLSVSQQMDILACLEASLPAFSYYNQNWHPSSRNWLNFYWKGYTQSTRYSFIIRSGNGASIRAAYNENVRRNIKKAASRVTLHESGDVELLHATIQNTFKRKGQVSPYNIELLKALYAACSARNCARIWLAADDKGHTHAAMFLLWDEHSVYYMAGGINEDFKNSGAMTWLFDKAISFAMESGRDFDFEGSMIEPIAAFFRSFGAQPQEYYVVTKVPSKSLRLQFALSKIHPWFSPFK
jgi:hypothetical protein